MLKWAFVAESFNDDLQFPQQRVSYLGKLADGVPIYPYGFHANASPESLALLFSAQGTHDNIAFFPTSNQDRTQLKLGETTFYHPLSGGHATWHENGVLEIVTGDDGKQPITIICNNATIQASETITVDCPETTINGNVTIEGNYTSNGTMTNNDKDVGSTHRHSQGNDTRGDGEAIIEGVL